MVKIEVIIGDRKMFAFIKEMTEKRAGDHMTLELDEGEAGDHTITVADEDEELKIVVSLEEEPRIPVVDMEDELTTVEVADVVVEEDTREELLILLQTIPSAQRQLQIQRGKFKLANLK